ncbi:MAG TPA: ABC transporter substrate-binding protein, partial [Rubrobacter sp.]|nr:ABC transporter substrate-binding protein [Rubrobacter sp.]
MMERNEGSRVSARRKFNRRDFLKMGGAGLAGAALLGATGCGGGGGGSGDLIFSMGPDDEKKTMSTLIDKFNKQSKDFKVQYRVMPSDTGQYFDKIRTQFQAGGGDIDVIGGDVIWPAQFAANGWIADVTDKFPASEQQKFLEAPLNSVTYDGKVYGVPWYTDAGMLYYRKDLLEKSGFSEPPKTWDELKEMADKVTQDQGTKYGFVFQGDQYEGGVCDGLEYIWTHGGDVLDPSDPNKVIIDSPEAAAGLATEASMLSSGVTPEAVATYTESETDPAFMASPGDSVFARNWPYMYGSYVGTKGYLSADQVGVAPLPVGDGPLTSCLGGWDMLINAQSDMQDEAWEFVKFMTSEENMRFRAIEATVLPARASLLKDPEIRKIPVVAQGAPAIENTHARPVSPYYSDMSLEMQEQFNRSLKGEVSPEDAVKTLQDSLEQIIEAG